MFESAIGDTYSEPIQRCHQGLKYHWFQSLVEIFKRYKSDFFGAGDSEARNQRMIDYTVKPSNKFVLAKYTDGSYRPACIAGRSKKMQLFIVSFYHSKKCLYVRPVDIIFRHGNLLNFRVSFICNGRHMNGKVYGNNSPANKGFPSIFYIKKRERWYKVPFKMVFMTKKQFNRFKFDCIAPERRMWVRATEADINKLYANYDALSLQEHMRHLQRFDGDFEMS